MWDRPLSTVSVKFELNPANLHTGEIEVLCMKGMAEFRLMGKSAVFLQDLLLLLTLQIMCLCLNVTHHLQQIQDSIIVHECTFPIMYLAMDVLFPEHKSQVISPVLIQPTIKT